MNNNNSNPVNLGKLSQQLKLQTSASRYIKILRDNETKAIKKAIKG